MTASAAWEARDDHDEGEALEQHDEDIPGVRPGERRTGLVHVPARAKPRPVLKVVGGIWRADPPLVLAVNITRPVDPSAEIEVLQRHQVIAANLVLRGHLVKLNMGEGKPPTSLPVARIACARTVTAGAGRSRIIWRSTARSCMQKSTFHEMLRPAMCLILMRHTLPSRYSMVTVIQSALNTPAVSASVCTLAQFVPLQMSEPWHSSKPARQVQAARVDGCRGDHGRRAIEGVSALLLPLPLRYAAVVPAQNASGCVMPPRCQTFSTSMTVSWTRKNVVTRRG
eukprot:scaffold33864_cov71-Phaeocystis_antarctica.AAC.3